MFLAKLRRVNEFDDESPVPQILWQIFALVFDMHNRFVLINCRIIFIFIFCLDIIQMLAIEKWMLLPRIYQQQLTIMNCRAMRLLSVDIMYVSKAYIWYFLLQAWLRGLINHFGTDGGFVELKKFFDRNITATSSINDLLLWIRYALIYLIF